MKVITLVLFCGVVFAAFCAQSVVADEQAEMMAAMKEISKIVDTESKKQAKTFKKAQQPTLKEALAAAKKIIAVLKGQKGKFDKPPAAKKVFTETVAAMEQSVKQAAAGGGGAPAPAKKG